MWCALTRCASVQGKDLEAKIRAKFITPDLKVDPEPLVELMILSEKDFSRQGIAKAIAAWAQKRGASMIIMVRFFCQLGA